MSAIKSRVATIDPHHRRLLVSRNTRMSLALAIGPDQSISVTLNTSIYNAAKQTAMVRLTGAARRGDFVNEKPDNPSFTSLYDQYTLAISALLQHAE